MGGNLVAASGSQFAQLLDDVGAVRIPGGAGNAGDEQRPVRRLRLRRQRLKGLSINRERQQGRMQVS